MKLLFQIPIILFVTLTSSTTSAESSLRGANEKDNEHENSHRRLGEREQNSRCKDLSFLVRDGSRTICNEIFNSAYYDECKYETWGISHKVICPETCSDKDSKYNCIPWDRSERVDSCEEDESIRINKNFGNFRLQGFLCNELKLLSPDLRDEVCDVKKSGTHYFQHCPRTCTNTGCISWDHPDETHVGSLSF